MKEKLKNAWYKVKDFFGKIKNNSLYILIVGILIFLLIYGRKIIDHFFAIFSNTTEKLREEKEKQNQTFTATKTGSTDNTKITIRKSTTQKVANDLIAENQREIERLKAEGK
jgi:hypothetical protein